jgi:hypothetical protein
MVSKIKTAVHFNPVINRDKLNPFSQLSAIEIRELVFKFASFRWVKGSMDAGDHNKFQRLEPRAITIYQRD